MINQLICMLRGHKMTNHIMNIDKERALYQCETCKHVAVGIHSSEAVKDYVEKEHKFSYSV